ncbi:MAG: VPLPA-CTERM sorting domain-containing protein [Gammaproteobacteria bacterium]|nr:VPLPA-CTERM sorting domain-containing protein [Gammaproteobacteria bacterium]
MKKILINVLTSLLGTSLLAMPVSATFYSGHDSYASTSGASESSNQAPGASDDQSSDDPGKSLAQEMRDERYRNFLKNKKLQQKRARNSAYGHYGKGSGKGSSGHWGSNNGSKGSKGGSKGSKGGGLDNEQRAARLEEFKTLLLAHLKDMPKRTGDQSGKWSQDFDSNYWTDDRFQDALDHWLIPHLHEDSKWVNKYWARLYYKIWWWIKNHNPHTPPDKPDPPEVPLPASAYLFGSALLGLGAIGRRRNHAKRA